MASQSRFGPGGWWAAYGLLGVDATVRVSVGGQCLACGLPGGIAGVELAAQVRAGEPGDRRDTVGVFVGGSGDAAERVCLAVGVSGGSLAGFGGRDLLSHDGQPDGGWESLPLSTQRI
jgi:hypothetical protein